MKPVIRQRKFQGLWLVLLGLVLLRLVSLGLYPVMETTEARYAEIARLMIESNDWITPWFDYGVPFWGKPPASFWLTAISMRVFGLNEFAARFPHFLGGLGIGYMTWRLARQRSVEAGVYAPILLAGSLLFFISAGAVMTDVTLVIGTTLTMFSFWNGLHTEGRSAQFGRWGMFVGLAIGLLAKGPIALILSGFPLMVWTIWQSQFGRVWRVFPWICGILLVIVLTLPWYVLAEQHTPGFLKYFIIGEHWDRFVHSGWKGDLYGTAHAYPRGTIWLFALAALLPWTFLLPLAALWWRRSPSNVKPATKNQAWLTYLVIWGLTPCIFFTFAGNIIVPYVLPALPATALLGAYWLVQRFSVQRASRILFIGVGCVVVIIIAAIIQLGRMEKSGDIKSTKVLIQTYQLQRTPNDVLVYYGNRSFSATFYLRAPIEKIISAPELVERLQKGSVYAIVDTNEVSSLQSMIKQPLNIAGQTRKWSLVTTQKFASTTINPMPSP
jgi:4-amino-4-deoxy-L-arabinose transferase-like glycosyltransferase